MACATLIAQVNIDLFNQYNLIKYNYAEFKFAGIYFLSQLRVDIDVKRRNWLHSCEKSFRQVIDS